MTGLRPTRRRVLAALGAGGAGVGGLYAVPPRRVAASLHRYDYTIGVRPAGPGGIDRVRALEEPVRGAVRAAVEGGYESSDPPDELLEYLRTPSRPTHVRSGESYYRLEPTLAVYRAWLEPVEASAAGNAVTFDEFEACYHPDPRGFVPPPMGSPSDPAARYHVDPRLRECIQRHPYVERGGETFRYRLTVDDPGPPYRLEAEPVPARSLARVPERATVVDWSDLDPSVRDVLLAADERTVVRDEVPEGLLRLAETADYVRRDGRFLEPVLGTPTGQPVAVSCEVADPVSREFDPAWLRLAVRNTGDVALDVSSQPPVPFGVLRVEDGDDDVVLWSPAYGEHGHHYTVAGRVEDRNLGLVHEAATVGPGETLSVRYGVRRDPGRLSTGEYVGRIGFRVAESDGDPGPYDGPPVRVDLTVTVTEP